MRNRTKKKKMPKIRVAFLLFCTVVPIMHFLVFYVISNAAAFPLAFQDSQGHFTVDNFLRFWNEMRTPGTQFYTALKNTMITFLIGVARYPFQVLVSYFLYKKVPGSKVYRIMFFLPSMLFSVATALIYQQMLSPEGIIAQFVGKALRLDYVPELLADSATANYTIWGQMLWLGFAGDLIIWGGTFARIPDDVIESARLDGVTWWQEFTRIIVPLVWPTVALQMVLMLCGMFSASGSVWLLTKGDYGTHTISSWMYRQMVESTGAGYTPYVFNYLSAAGLTLSAIAIVISFVVRRWTNKVFDDVEF